MKRALILAIFFATTFATTLAAAEAEKPVELSPIWRWANFLILAGALAYVMGKTLPGLFSARSSEIRKGISEAQKMKQDAERRAAEMDARLAALGADIENFRTQSAAEMKQEGERISSETVAQIKKVEQQAAIEIETVGKTVRRQLKEYAGELALGLAEQRLRSGMDKAAESALVDGFVHDLQKQASQNTGSKN